MKWTDIPHGIVTATEQRLWVALGDNADGFAYEINTDPAFLASIAQYVNARVEFKKRPFASHFETVGKPVKLSAISRFVARDSFKEGNDGEVPIYDLSHNFKENFLNVEENNVKATVVQQYELLKPDMYNAEVLSFLGEKDLNNIKKSKVSLAHVFEFLKTARHHLAWFIFYVADAKGVVWSLYATWSTGDPGWCIGVLEVTNSNCSCHEGGIVVSA